MNVGRGQCSAVPSGRWLLSAALSLLLPSTVCAQSAATAPQDAPQERSTGLPSAVDWTFGFDAGWGTFGFANSLFDNPKEPVAENLSDQWFEGFVRPSLAGVYRFSSSSELYGTLSAVGTRTYGSLPGVINRDVSSFGPEQAAIGWRSGASVGGTTNLIDVTVGRAPYALGHGMLLMDGAADGGSRGGTWSNARQAFEMATIGRVKPGPHLAEVFYLDRDDLPEHDDGTRLWGINYEWSPDEDSTIGATYMKFHANVDARPERDGLSVFNARAYTAPFRRLRGLSIEFEYASERNGEALDSNAWTLLAAYQLTAARWAPKFSYRHAFFQGDDPDTAAREAFDPLLPGFEDWGSWWQGEIAGEYFLPNSNLISHQVRAHFEPSDRLGAGVLAYNFRLDQPLTGAEGSLTSNKAIAFELDVYADWKVTSNITLSLVGAFANPDAVVQQATGRTSNFTYGMAYVGYSF